jgi:hypothetical protein
MFLPSDFDHSVFDATIHPLIGTIGLNDPPFQRERYKMFPTISPMMLITIMLVINSMMAILMLLIPATPNVLVRRLKNCYRLPSVGLIAFGDPPSG